MSRAVGQATHGHGTGEFKFDAAVAAYQTALDNPNGDRGPRHLRYDKNYTGAYSNIATAKFLKHAQCVAREQDCQERDWGEFIEAANRAIEVQRGFGMASVSNQAYVAQMHLMRQDPEYTTTFEMW